MLKLLHTTNSYFFYTLEERPDFLLCTLVRAVGPGRPVGEFESRSPAFIVALRDFLLTHKMLLRSGGSPVFLFGARAEQPATDDQARALLTDHFAFGYQYCTAPLKLVANSALADIDRLTRHELAATVADLCTNPQGERLLTLLPLRPTGGFSGLVIKPDQIPELGARLLWPLVGDVPENPAYEVPAAPPECGKDYPHLKELFDEFWLDAGSHARLHMFLLGCFDSSYLTHSVPLLVLDSWCQGLGKTEAAEAVANVLHGYRTPSLSPPRTPTPDQIASHYGAGHLVAMLDNLDGVTDWNHPWLASILTQRGAAERLRYDRASTNFRGRCAVLTYIYGRATLHDDLISRAWRVQIWGDTSRWAAGPPKHFAKDYALDFRDELISECYWAMKRGRDRVTTMIPDRCTVFSQRAAGAYLEAFGVDPGTVLLTDTAHRAMMGTLALQVLKRERVVFPRRPVNVDVLPVNAPTDLIEGGTALGHVVRDGKVVATERTA